MKHDLPAATTMAHLAMLLLAGSVVIGGIWYGFSAETYQRIWKDILDRPSGPMTFRFFIQPTIAAGLAIHDGLSDARRGRQPFVYTILFHPSERSARVREGVMATARMVLLGVIVDGIYQYQVLRGFYPGEAVLVALLLAVVPYAAARGPAARIARRWIGPRDEPASHQVPDR